ncbi:hypothetical protein FRB90_008696 [Tulasnella sp. 427]|nr:hypothetical protein FRB90_008696 [Tulasnella sp. 427]
MSQENHVADEPTQALGRKKSAEELPIPATGEKHGADSPKKDLDRGLQDQSLSPADDKKSSASASVAVPIDPSTVAPIEGPEDPKEVEGETEEHRVDQPSSSVASEPDPALNRVTDADVHDSLGLELDGKLIKGIICSLGPFVDVFQGSWCPSTAPNSEHPVAIKVLRAFAIGKDDILEERLRVLHNASLGLQHLHTLTPPIAHGNICPSNVLINEAREAVISDFEMSKVVEENPSELTTSGGWGNLNGYSAPEALSWDSGSRASLPMDVYAFGGVTLALGRQIKEDVHSTTSSPRLSQEVVNVIQEGPSDDPEDAEQGMITELPGELIHETDPEEEITCRGGFSDVVKGRWIRPNGVTAQVALKYLRPTAMQTSPTTQDKVVRMNKRVDREALVWRRLHSPYILELYGFRSGEQPCLISPWCSKGTLRDYLEANPLLTTVEKLELLVLVGKGLQYLHEQSPPISHGDIKPSNILIDDNNCPKLCDFGLSQVLEEIDPLHQTSFVGQGSKGYQSPELLRDGLQNLSSDVYAFACVVVEVLSGKPPFYKLKPSKAFLAISAGSIPDPSAHPKLPPSDPLWDILRKCWAAAPMRPSMKDVVQMVKGFFH